MRVAQRRDYRFQMQLPNGSYVKAHSKLVGAKIAVATYGRLYGSVYRAVDTHTGEVWAWDPKARKVVRVERG